MAFTSADSAPRAPLSRHPAFAPLVTVWLAALLGGVIAVLPAPIVSQLAANGPVAMPAQLANPLAIAGVAVLAGAILGWLGARAIYAVQNRSKVEPVVAVKAEAEPEVVEEEQVEPIQLAELAAADDTEEFTPVPIDAPDPEPEIATQTAPEAVAEPPVHWDDTVFEQAAPSEVAEQRSDDGAAPLPVVDILGEMLASEIIPAAEPVVDEPEHNPTPGDIGEEIETSLEAPESQVVAQPDATPEPIAPQHGKAVNLLRTQDTNELAMPQLVERFAVALEDRRQLSEGGVHSYSPPTEMAARLRTLAQTPSRSS